MFKKRTQEERILKERERILTKWIRECRKSGYLDETILRRLRELEDIPQSFLAKNFEINLIKEVINNPNKSEEEVKQMPKKKKDEDYEDDEESEDEDEEEESEDEDSEEDEEEPEEDEPKKKKKGKSEKEPKITVEQILRSHEARLQAVESSIYRIRAI